VALTRPDDRAHEWALRLEDQDAIVELYPLIRTEPPRSFEALDAALRALRRFDWVLFTSVNGVTHALARASAKPAGDPRRPQVAAIGPATARALEDRGWPVDLVPAASSAEGLAAALLAGGVRGRRLLLVRAESGRDVLPDLLRACGADVAIAPAYRTVPDAGSARALAARLQEVALDAVVFASPSAVRALAGEGGSAPLTWPDGCRLVCIGEPTAEAARAAGWPVAATLAEPTIEDLGAALAALRAPR